MALEDLVIESDHYCCCRWGECNKDCVKEYCEHCGCEHCLEHFEKGE